MRFNLVDNSKHRDYNEIQQRLKIRFSYAKVEGDNVIQQHHPVKCRDFLGDTLLWRQQLAPVGIHLYDYDDEVEPSLLVFGVVAPENIEVINDWEKHFGMKPSQLDHVKDDIYLIRGDERWISTTFHISWWTFLIRTCLGEKTPNFKQELQAVRCSLLEPKDVSNKLQELLKGLQCKTVWPVKKEHKDWMHFHNNNGFCTLLRFSQYFE